MSRLLLMALLLGLSIRAGADLFPDNAASTAAAQAGVADALAVCEEGPVSACAQAKRAVYSPQCESGDLQACVKAGDAYTDDVVDLDRAAASYARACDGGVAEGCQSLGGLYDSPALIQIRDQQRASTYFQRARALYVRGCESNDARSCAGLLGMLEAHQISGTPIEIAGLGTKTRSLFEADCTAGKVSACNDLADLCVRAGREDNSCYVSGLERACALHDGKACWVLGWTYRKGARGVHEDARRAAENFQRACSAGYKPGCNP
jgi:TPR repeat protein